MLQRINPWVGLLCIGLAGAGCAGSDASSNPSTDQLTAKEYRIANAEELESKLSLPRTTGPLTSATLQSAALSGKVLSGLAALPETVSFNSDGSLQMTYSDGSYWGAQWKTVEGGLEIAFGGASAKIQVAFIDDDSIKIIFVGVVGSDAVAMEGHTASSEATSSLAIENCAATATVDSTVSPSAAKNNASSGPSSSSANGVAYMPASIPGAYGAGSAAPYVSGSSTTVSTSTSSASPCSESGEPATIAESDAWVTVDASTILPSWMLGTWCYTSGFNSSAYAGVSQVIIVPQSEGDSYVVQNISFEDSVRSLATITSINPETLEFTLDYAWTGADVEVPTFKVYGSSLGVNYGPFTQSTMIRESLDAVECSFGKSLDQQPSQEAGSDSLAL